MLAVIPLRHNRDARLDPKVKAIVLVCNSPGGSVTASEVISLNWQQPGSG